jgi:hypothetical protein
MFLEVDVEPLAARGSRLSGDLGDEGGADALTPLIRHDHGVKDKRVGSSFPSYVDEADETVLPSGANPPEAVLMELGYPVMLGRLVAEAVTMERFQLGVGKGTSPLVKYALHGRRS